MRKHLHSSLDSQPREEVGEGAEYYVSWRGDMGRSPSYSYIWMFPTIKNTFFPAFSTSRGQGASFTKDSMLWDRKPKLVCFL